MEDYESVYSDMDLITMNEEDLEPSEDDFKMLCKFVRTYYQFDKYALVPNVNSENGWKFIIEFIDKLEGIKSLEKKRKALYQWISDHEDSPLYMRT